MNRDRTLPALALAAGGAVVPIALLHFVGREEARFSNSFHFDAVGGSAVAATAAAVALGVIGARRGDARAVLVGTAFSVMAGLLVVHGISTPGVLVGENGVVAFSGAATLPVGGAVLALAALPSLRGAVGVRRLLALQVVLLSGVVGLGVLGMLVPEAVPAVPETGGRAAIALLSVGLGFYGLLGLRAARTYLLARRRADLVVLAGIGWLAAALAAALILRYSELGWWLGHGFELAGILLVGAPVVFDLLRTAPSRPLAGDLRGADLVVQAEAFLGADVRALLRRLGEKDAYTDGHTRRVALLAVQVGEELALPPARLRALAIGGLLHDIGKLSIPDAILKKPGPLDEREFELIRRHPLRGDRLVGELGFPSAVRRLVLDHHERLDGKGYPRGLGYHTLGFDTRVLTVCDVYDALISQRVYRDAWTPEEALELLHAESGTAFDPRCLAALERVLERAHGVARAPASSAPSGRLVAWLAGEASGFAPRAHRLPGGWVFRLR